MRHATRAIGIGSRTAVPASELPPLSVHNNRFPAMEPAFPNVKCSHCSAIDKWKKMRIVKLFHHIQETLSDVDDDFTWWEYTCVDCVQQQLSCTKREAVAQIYEKSATWVWAKARNAKYRAAVQGDARPEPDTTH